MPPGWGAQIRKSQRPFSTAMPTTSVHDCRDRGRKLAGAVKKAALAQTGAVDSDKTQILADVGDVFAETSLTKDDDGMPCQALVDALVAMPDRSWSECNRGKALTDPTKGEDDARVQERGSRVEQELLLRAGQPQCFVNQYPLRLRNS